MNPTSLLTSLKQLIESINARDVAEFYSPNEVERLVNLLKQAIVDLINAMEL